METMKKFWNMEPKDYTSSARVVDGTLILSLPDAINPVVWRMELGNIKASALEIRTQENGASLLVLKTPKGETYEIAPFSTRQAALDALMRVSTALQSTAARKIDAPAPGIHIAAPGNDNDKTGWLWAAAGLLIVLLLFVYLATLIPDASPTGTATQTSSGSSGDSGVPQSADELLQGF
jgi:hypothetical protein